MTRPGQKTFNWWDANYPEIVDQLRGTDVDCYYDDSKRDAFQSAAVALYKKAYPEGKVLP